MSTKESHWRWREVTEPLGFVVFRDSNPPDTPMLDDDVNSICHCEFAPDAQRIAHALEAYDQLCAENARLRLTLDSEPLAAVMKLANKHYCEGTWRDQPDTRWLAGMVEKVGELASALHGRHEHTPDVELQQIASIALNWLNMRRVHGA